MESPLEEEYRLSFDDILQGKHRSLLNPNAQEYRMCSLNFPIAILSNPSGIWDRTEEFKKIWPEEIMLAQEIRRTVNCRNRRLIEIDVAFPPTTIKDALDEHLTTWHKGVSDSDKQKARTEVRFRPVDLLVWINYFRCYDLREEKGKTFGAIAKQVYGSGDPKERARKRDRAEKAYSRVQGIIKLAEQNQWPPPVSFSG